MFMMDIWTGPVLIVIGVIAAITIASVRKYNRYKVVLNEEDQKIPDSIEEHPFTLNPVVWVIAVAAAFILFVIFYYWASVV